MSEVNKLLDAWYHDTVIEDVKDCNTVANMAVKETLEKFDIGLDEQHTLAIYCVTYDEIIRELMKKREDNPDRFVINIADVVKIGYDNIEEDEDSETQGNFNVFIEHVGNTPENPDEGSSTNSVDTCNQWLHSNIKEQRKIIETISAQAVKRLHEDLEIEIASSSVIIPIWVTIHRCLVEYLNVKRSEKNESDCFINFCNAMEVHCQLREDGSTMIGYKPNISEKLNIKSNAIASSGDE